MAHTLRRTHNLRPRPWVTTISALLTVVATLLWVSFKCAYGLRHYLASPDAQSALDTLLHLLSTHLYFNAASILTALWAVLRGERLWGVGAFWFSGLCLAVQFAYL
jgi:hypothetical protein